MSQKSTGYYLDLLNERIERQLAKNPTELLNSKTYHVELDNEEIFQFFSESPEEFVGRIRKIIGSYCRQYNYPLDAKEVRIIIDTSYFVIKKIRELKTDSYNKAVC